MTQGIISLQLVRDGSVTAWGFRLSGGADVGAPLVIQRVFLGSPSEGELQRGDIIVKIRDKDAKTLSHKQASDLITSSGNKLQMSVLRSGAPMAGGKSPPISPSPVSFPIMNSVGPTTVYHFTTSTTHNTTPTPYPPPNVPPGTDRLFQPLPTTQFQDGMPVTADAIRAQQEWIPPEFREKIAITNQAYRTFPLISPQAKTRQDTLHGSYLRFMHDPTRRLDQPRPMSEPPRRFDDALMRTKVQETVLTAASNSPRASRTPTPDLMGGPKVVPLQYNSPINLYSQQNVAEAITSQTGAQPTPLRDALREVILNVATCISSPMVNDHSGPEVRHPSPLQDISKSPTYKLIHETEVQEVKECNPIDHRVYDLPTIYETGGLGGLKSFSFAHGKIHQSGSFKTLMTSLAGVTEF